VTLTWVSVPNHDPKPDREVNRSSSLARTFIADEVIPGDDPVARPEASTQIGVQVVDACGQHAVPQPGMLIAVLHLCCLARFCTSSRQQLRAVARQICKATVLLLFDKPQQVSLL